MLRGSIGVPNSEANTSPWSCHWSPQQIAQWLRQEFREEVAMQALVIATIPSVTAVPDGSSRVSRPRYASPSDRLERAARMPTAIGSNSDSTRRRGAAEEVAAGLAGNGARTKVRAGECRRCLLHVVYATGTAPGGKRWVRSSPARSRPSARRAASAAGRLHRARPRARKG